MRKWIKAGVGELYVNEEDGRIMASVFLTSHITGSADTYEASHYIFDYATNVGYWYKNKDAAKKALEKIFETPQPSVKE